MIVTGEWVSARTCSLLASARADVTRAVAGPPDLHGRLLVHPARRKSMKRLTSEGSSSGWIGPWMRRRLLGSRGARLALSRAEEAAFPSEREERCKSGVWCNMACLSALTRWGCVWLACAGSPGPVCPCRFVHDVSRAHALRRSVASAMVRRAPCLRSFEPGAAPLRSFWRRPRIALVTRYTAETTEGGRLRAAGVRTGLAGARQAASRCFSSRSKRVVRALHRCALPAKGA